MQDGLGRFEVEELLQVPLGEDAIKLAIRFSCKHVLSQPPVQSLLTREWRGPLFDGIVEGTDTDLSWLLACLSWLLAAAANLVLLPLVAACPPLESQLVRYLKRNAAQKLVASQLPAARARRGSLKIPDGEGSPVVHASLQTIVDDYGAARRPPLLHYYLI